MSRGVLIFATDSQEIKYTDLAKWSQKRIEQHLDLPVTIVSNPPVSRNQRWFDDFDANVSWSNFDRCQAFDLSPYDQTLVLDADYVVGSDCLLSLFDSGQSFLCHGHAHDVTSQSDVEHLNSFGKFRMPMAWATVMYFDRRDHARAIFQFMKMVQDNWMHYRNIYQFSNSLYRNDFALSIALTVLNGYRIDWPSIPWSLLSIEPRHTLEKQGDNEFTVTYTDQKNRQRYVTLKNCDFHAMGKKSLGALIANSA
jgi:hypothetical protein